MLSLFQARRYWSGAELSERLEVTARTLRRDVDRLRSLGYPVHSTSGAAGGYQLGAGGALPPLLLDDDEAVAVAVGLRTAASGSVDGIEEVSVRALAKVEQVLPARLRRRVAALNSSIVPLVRPGPTVDADTLLAIAGACRDSETVRFGYRSRDGTASDREVEPHRLVHTGRRWYLAAWDTTRGAWRTFRVDRIQPKISAGARFTPRRPPEGGFAEYVSKSVSYSAYQFRATVLLRAPLEAIAPRIPPSVATLERAGEHSCILRAGAASLDGLSIYLALIGCDFEVQEPPELIELVAQIGERFNRSSKASRPEIR